MTKATVWVITYGNMYLILISATVSTKCSWLEDEAVSMRWCGRSSKSEPLSEPEKLFKARGGEFARAVVGSEASDAKKECVAECVGVDVSSKSGSGHGSKL